SRKSRQRISGTQGVELCAPGSRLYALRAPAGMTGGTSDVLEVAMPALALGEALGAGDALGLDDRRARRPLAFQALAHRLAPCAVGRQAIGAHARLREAGDLLRHRL